MTDGTPLIDQDLLARLACPRTLKPLVLASAEILEQINAALEKGEIKTMAGEPRTSRIEGALMVEDEQIFYPIQDSIPVLLVEEAFQLA